MLYIFGVFHLKVACSSTSVSFHSSDVNDRWNKVLAFETVYSKHLPVFYSLSDLWLLLKGCFSPYRVATMQDTQLWLIRLNMIFTFYPVGLSTLKSLPLSVSVSNRDALVFCFCCTVRTCVLVSLSSFWECHTLQIQCTYSVWMLSSTRLISQSAIYAVYLQRSNFANGPDCVLPF